MTLIYVNGVHAQQHIVVQAVTLSAHVHKEPTMNAPVEKVIGDVRILTDDVEELVKATATQSGEKLAEARARVQRALAGAKDTVVVRGTEAAHAADRYVHQNAWKAIGVSAGIALLAGLLIGRR